jgi:hypothetical protein
MKPLGERMRMAQKLIALDLNDETDQTLTREERAAALIAERLLENGASSSLARTSPDESALRELLHIFENI